MFWMGSSKDYKVIYSYQFVISSPWMPKSIWNDKILNSRSTTTFFDSHSANQEPSTFDMCILHEKIKSNRIAAPSFTAKQTKPEHERVIEFKIQDMYGKPYSCFFLLFMCGCKRKKNEKKIKREKRISCRLWRPVVRSVSFLNSMLYHFISNHIL